MIAEEILGWPPERWKVKDTAFYPQSLLPCPSKCNCITFNALACSQGFFSWLCSKIRLQEEKHYINTSVLRTIFVVPDLFLTSQFFFCLTFYMKTKKTVHFICQFNAFSFLHLQNYRVLSERQLFCLQAFTSQQKYTWPFLSSLVIAFVK